MRACVRARACASALNANQPVRRSGTSPSVDPSVRARAMIAGGEIAIAVGEEHHNVERMRRAGGVSAHATWQRADATYPIQPKVRTPDTL
jgi:hypothetical protein